MADFTPQPPQGKFPERSYREFLLQKLRPGDIATHCLAIRYPFLTADGRLNPDVLKAKERGVKFDLGHAGASFMLRLVVPAPKQGFIPDTISADLFSDTPYTTGINLANIMTPPPYGNRRLAGAWGTCGVRKFPSFLQPCGSSIVNMFEVKAGDCRHEQIGLSLSASQGCDPIVTRAVAGQFREIQLGVVDDDGAQIAAFENDVMLRGNMKSNGGICQAGKLPVPQVGGPQFDPDPE